MTRRSPISHQPTPADLFDDPEFVAALRDLATATVEDSCALLFGPSRATPSEIEQALNVCALDAGRWFDLAGDDGGAEARLPAMLRALLSRVERRAPVRWAGLAHPTAHHAAWTVLRATLLTTADAGNGRTLIDLPIARFLRPSASRLIDAISLGIAGDWRGDVELAGGEMPDPSELLALIECEAADLLSRADRRAAAADPAAADPAPPAIDAPEGLAAADAARFLGISTSQLRSLDSRGLCPAPAQLGDGRCPRFSRGELAAWLRAGCPARSRWSAMRDAALSRLN